MVGPIQYLPSTKNIIKAKKKTMFTNCEKNEQIHYRQIDIGIGLEFQIEYRPNMEFLVE